jgi:hypothetical protein
MAFEPSASAQAAALANAWQGLSQLDRAGFVIRERRPGWWRAHGCSAQEDPGISVDRRLQLRLLVAVITEVHSRQTIGVAPQRSWWMISRTGYAVLTRVERDKTDAFATRYPARPGSGRALGMLALAREGRFKTGELVLFWHTGGTPACWLRRPRS